MKTYTFPCKCSYRILSECANGGIPRLDFMISDIKKNLNCPATWNLLAQGLTKGVFQLESHLGKTYTKELKPENIEHLAALGAILRPGCLQSKDENNISITKHYCLRKNKQEEVVYYHPILEPILKSTYGVLVYQEQAMKIAQVVAGFTLQEADVLRKAIGKKIAEEMAKVKIMFLEGVKKKNLISEADAEKIFDDIKEKGPHLKNYGHEVAMKEAEEIFGWIEKSQRYSFNKSHSVCYGINGYISAYLKAHFPLQFFTLWLYYAKDKSKPMKEIKELINDAKQFDIQILPPDIKSLKSNFSTNGKVITFGVADIKGIAEAQTKKIRSAINDVEQELNKKIENFNWHEVLIYLAEKVSYSVLTKLITVGALRHINMSRNQMLNELRIHEKLTDKGREWLKLAGRKFSSYLEALQKLSMYGTISKNKAVEVESFIKLIQKPPTSLVDSPNWIAWNEETLLGVPLSCSKIDGCALDNINTTCKQYLQGTCKGYMIFGLQIDSVKEIRTRNGKQAGSKMAFINASDNTGSVELTAFPDTWKDLSNLFAEGNTVMVQAEKDKKRDSLIIKSAQQI